MYVRMREVNHCRHWIDYVRSMRRHIGIQINEDVLTVGVTGSYVWDLELAGRHYLRKVSCAVKVKDYSLTGEDC